MNPRWQRYLRFFGPDPDADVDDELRFHLEMKAEELAARGMAPEVAARVARERFGDVDQVRSWLRQHDRARQRRAERVEYMDTLLQDVRYGVRKLVAQPGFSAAVVVVLALGIGAATAMFSAVDTVLLRPLPFAHADRLVAVKGVHLPFELSRDKSAPHPEDLRAIPEVFERVAAYAAPGGMNLGMEGSPHRLRVAVATPELFETLGVGPVIGRPFAPAEGVLNGPRVVLLSHGLWQRQFGGDPALVGQEIQLDGDAHLVIGVMPRGFAFPGDVEAWLPLPLPFGFSTMGVFEAFLPSTVIARLAPGVTPLAAGIRVHALAEQFASGDSELEMTAAEMVQPLRDRLVGTRRSALLVLLGATGLVLLVSCANATNLLLSRAAARRGEMALRATLGASRGRLLRQLLVESLLLALAGAVLGVLLAFASLGVLEALLPASMQGLVQLHVDGRVLLFTLGAATFTGLLFGLWPALGGSRTNLGASLRAGGVAGAGGGARDAARVRRTFVVAELALALMLAVGAGLMLRTLQSIMSTELGLLPEGVATMELSLSEPRFDSSAARRAFFDALRERLAATPGVEAVGSINVLPLRGGVPGVSISLHPEGTEPGPIESRTFAQMLVVDGEYFRAMGIPLLRGRMPEQAPPRARGEPAGVEEVAINEALAAKLWPGEDAIGRRYVFGHEELREVVGVVGDVRAQGLDKELGLQQYASMSARPWRKVAVVARGTLPPEVLTRRLREAALAVDPSLPVYNVRPMTEVVLAAAAPWRLNALLITTFGLVAVALAAVGVYGVIAHGVGQRTRELGIRMALGARRSDVLRLVVREGLVLAFAGVALGVAGAWALRRVLASLLHGVSPSDPYAFAIAAFALLVVALLATLLPARAGARVDPAVAMRAEG